ncbi:hypothetical protein JK359_19765 [Streptomyces actinomycinicus]|uniref:Uncharacterized protein n=1 Tax=Streptomyces actinomycinicus TaxID=1695166 RepID=A0A937JP97_9ACTN|nr:hypothetical protein [Streptomyces actinomycinicus]MBL1084176.1 hypothetical protein [Streptomyces actinomycinicus]
MDESPDRLTGDTYLFGTASDHGGVYQAGRDQTVTHFNVHVDPAPGLTASAHVARRVTPQAAQQHTQRVIEALALAVEHFRQRCVELAAEAQRARAEGRREALREVQEKLREAESRVIRAQAKKEEAERERERLENLMARTRYEAESARWSSARAPDDERTFEDILGAADDELRSIRAELRTLAEDLGRSEEPLGSHTVVRGDVVREARAGREFAEGEYRAMSGDSPKAFPSTRPGHPAARSAPRSAMSATRPGRFRRGLGRLFFVAAGLPMPMAGAAIRSMYSQEPGVAVVWSILFPVAAVLLAVGATSLLIFCARLTLAWQKDDGTVVVSCFFHAALGAGMFVVGISLSPAAVPPLTDCGRVIAEYVGPL